MGMTKCKECADAISTTAEVCPHCGFRLRKRAPAPKYFQPYSASAIRAHKRQSRSRFNPPGLTK